MSKSYNFNEKNEEWSRKQGKKIPVWVSPKFQQSKKKAIELLEKNEYGLTENDFWILMNETKSGKMGYTGLIISHNGCLKINDKLPKKDKFKPSSATRIKDEQGLILMQYINDEQGIFEYGEVSSRNCRNEYPNAMVLKRLQDRVILKNSKIAFDGIYSESEAEDFKYDDKSEPTQNKKAPLRKVVNQIKQEPFGTEQEIQATFIKLKEDLESCKTKEDLKLCFENAIFKTDLTKLDEVRKNLIIASKDVMKDKLK
jgi:hypothetical protein